MRSATEIDPATGQAARAFVARVSRQYDVVGAILFGSRARLNYRPDSDADIAILLKGQRGKFVDTKLALADIAYEVLLDSGIHIQPLPLWEDEWAHPEKSPNPALLRNISREGVRL